MRPPRCRRMSSLRHTLTPSSLSHSRRTGSLLELTIVFLLDLTDAVSITISPFMYSYSDRAPCGSPITLPGLLGSLGAKPSLVLHHSMMHQRKALVCPSSTHGPSHPSWSSPFTTCRRPSRRILHLHIQEIHQIYSTLSITHHQRVNTIGSQQVCGKLFL